MEWLQTLPGELAPGSIAITLGFILLGTLFQVATGVGLGLVAGPVLLYFLDSTSAVQIALLLNLILTFCLLPFDIKHASWQPLQGLSLWSLVGLLPGFLLFLLLDQSLLKLLGASVILLAVAQLKFFPHGSAHRAPTQTTSASPAPTGTTAESDDGSPAPVSTRRTPARGSRLLAVGGCLSGAMTATLAVPGPLALWTLLSLRMEPIQLRGTLRGYFLIAYSAALLLHLTVVGSGEKTAAWTLALLPGVLLGLGIGLMARRLVNREFLQRLFEWILLLMGLSLLCKGILDVI